MHENERRQALADFLRRRRASLSPADVGLPTGVRRRTPGLRREEVAQLANIGTSWYIWLEQGRDVHPSAQVLESLAQALRLTLNERRHLFLLAGQSLPPHAFPEEECVSPTLQRVLDNFDPAPAYVLGRRLDYIAWNKAADVIFTITEAPHPYGRNMVWRLFTSPVMRQLPYWEQLARSTLAEFHTASARYPGDQCFEALIAELKRVSPDFCRLWPLHDASSSLDGHKAMHHPELGFLEFDHVTLQNPGDPDVKIMLYAPLGETGSKLQHFLQAASSYQPGTLSS